MNLYALIPSVDKIMTALCAETHFANLPRAFLRERVNHFINLIREEIKVGALDSQSFEWDVFFNRAKAYVLTHTRPHLKRVLNASGVVVHTNLGRSILSESAVKSVIDVCQNYSNLEFDLESGERGSRHSHVEPVICSLTGAQSALVVNNNAAAVFLILDTLAKNKEVIVSRGELVEIGGSFRIPDIMRKSGAILCETGTTNRTHLYDYENLITEQTAAFLKVHTSNFRVIGFHKEVFLPELIKLSKTYHLPVIYDLGSGTLFPFQGIGIIEPTVQSIIKDGADIVCFSGDKLLGGPQAGIIVGKKDLIDKLKQNPLARALRIDKMTLAALEATLFLYFDQEKARQEIPTLKMITLTPVELKKKANILKKELVKFLSSDFEFKILAGNSRVGGGAFPECDLPTTLVGCIWKNGSADLLRKRLLNVEIPLIGLIVQDMFCLDPRTLKSEEFKLVLKALEQAISLQEVV